MNDIKREIRVEYDGSWTQWFSDDDPQLKELLFKEGVKITAIQTSELIPREKLDVMGFLYYADWFNAPRRT